jgi:site-specific DNA recombinase
VNKSKSVGIWIRVSTEDQARGESPEHHEKRARYYAESKGWEIKEVYHLEALSGKSVMGYSETQRMLKDLKSSRITGLIFSKLARLARNTRELLEFAEIFNKEDADLISLQESIDTSTPAGRLFYTMGGMRDGYCYIDSKQKQDRTMPFTPNLRGDSNPRQVNRMKGLFAFSQPMAPLESA